MGYVKKTDKGKAWTKKNKYSREVVITRIVRSIFLIFCEGGNTEPEYFRSFPVNSETIVKAIGLGMSRSALVNRIISICKEKEYLSGQSNYDADRQIWCVFDRDTRGIEDEDKDYNDAIQTAKKRGLNVAYSNDSFELWFILHDKYIDAKQTRKQFYEYLSKKFELNYEEDGKSLNFAKVLYTHYIGSQENAVKNAETLYKYHLQESIYSNKNPCTTVHLLVKELNKQLRK